MNRRKFLIKSNTYIIFSILAPRARGAALPADELRPFDAHSLASIRKVHAGKPFVLTFWSVYCEPCRDEMAEWNALKRKHPSLPIVLVSTDPPADRAQIDVFLAKYPPGPVQQWIFADAFTERVRYSVDKSWRGELPKSYFFDAAHRVEIKSGKVDRAWINAWAAKQALR